MEILLYISVVIAVIAILALATFIFVTVKSAKTTFSKVQVTLDSLESQLNGITTETETLLNQTNKIATDINEKSEKVDVLFDGVKGVGSTIQSFNKTLSTFTDNINAEAIPENGQASQVAKWGSVILDLWQKKKQ